MTHPLLSTSNYSSLEMIIRTAAVTKCCNWISFVMLYREISQVNKGRKMLEKMGWKKGEGLGKEGTGRKDPVRHLVRMQVLRTTELCADLLGFFLRLN